MVNNTGFGQNLACKAGSHHARGGKKWQHIYHVLMSLQVCKVYCVSFHDSMIFHVFSLVLEAAIHSLESQCGIDRNEAS